MMQACFCVTHRGGRIPVDRAKVSPPLNQQMACAPPLSHAHQGWINGHVSVGMEITHGLSHDLGTLHRFAVGLYPEAIHGVKDSTLRRLQSVAGIRQGAGDDDRHGVVEKRLLHLVGHVDRYNIFFHEGHGG